MYSMGFLIFAEPSSHSTDAETDPKSSPEFKYVTRRSDTRRIRVSRDKAVDTSPRRSSVPAVHSHSQNLSAYNNSGVRSHSPEYLSSSRQSSSSEDSSGPHSSRSADNYRLHPSELISSHSRWRIFIISEEITRPVMPIFVLPMSWL